MIEPDTGLVTAAALTKAAGPENSDAARGTELVTADTSIGTQKIEMLGDSAYGSGELLADITKAGHTPIIKPMPLGRAVPDGFTVDDFTIDDDAKTATSPRVSPARSAPRGASVLAVPASPARSRSSARRHATARR